MECTNPDLRELATSRGKDTAHIGVSQPHAIALMKGRRMPAARAINAIALALGIETTAVWAACEESCRRAQQTISGQKDADVSHAPGSIEGPAA